MPNNNLEFIECDTCRANPGSPKLCVGCVHNRKLIFEMLETNKYLQNIINAYIDICKEWSNLVNLLTKK